MSPEHVRIVGAALIGLTALLVGFHGASTLLTVTQMGASTAKSAQPRSHASLVPQPPIPAIKQEPPSAAAPAIPAGEEVPVSAEQPTVAPASAQVVADNPAGIAAELKAKAQAEMDAMGPQLNEDMPPPEPRRRYRAPRPELHKVY